MKTRTTITKDQYFTSVKAATDIVEWLTNKGWFDGVQTIVETCTGAKALVNAIEARHPNIKILMYDLYPLTDDIVQVDSLTLVDKKTGLIKGLDPKTTKIFSNPPFGYSNSLAKKFVRTFKKYDACWILTRGNLLGELAFLEDYEITDTLEIDSTFYNNETGINHNVDCLAFDFRVQTNSQLELFLISLDWFDNNIGHIVSKKYDKMLNEYRNRPNYKKYNRRNML
jgi:hypothetical protein